VVSASTRTRSKIAAIPSDYTVSSNLASLKSIDFEDLFFLSTVVIAECQSLIVAIFYTRVLTAMEAEPQHFWF